MTSEISDLLTQWRLLPEHARRTVICILEGFFHTWPHIIDVTKAIRIAHAILVELDEPPKFGIYR